MAGPTGFVFIENDNFVEELAADESLRKPLGAVGREIAKAAKANTPRNSGATSRSIKFYTARLKDVDGVQTQVATVAAWDAIWHLIEYGSVNNPPYRPLTNAGKTVAGEMFVETGEGETSPEPPEVNGGVDA